MELKPAAEAVEHVHTPDAKLVTEGKIAPATTYRWKKSTEGVVLVRPAPIRPKRIWFGDPAPAE